LQLRAGRAHPSQISGWLLEPYETCPHPVAVGKLPQALRAAILARAPVDDPRGLLRPGIGLDCAVIDTGEPLTVYKSDPITFATDQIGH